MKQDIDLKRIIKVLLKRIWMIIAFSAAGLVLAFLVSSYIISPLYVSTTSLYVQNTEDEEDGPRRTLTDLQYAERLVNTYAFILKNKDFLSVIASRVDLGYSESDIRQMLQITGIKSTEVFQVSVSNNDPKHAKIIAEEIARMAPDEIKRVVKSGTIELIEAANVPQSPSFPNIKFNSLLGLMLGLAVSVVLAFLIEILDTTVKNATDLSETYGLPVLGSIPTIEAASKGAEHV